LIIFNTLLSSKLKRWFWETPFVPTKKTTTDHHLYQLQTTQLLSFILKLHAFQYKYWKHKKDVIVEEKHQPGKSKNEKMKQKAW